MISVSFLGLCGLETKLSLTFVRDNGVWNYKYGIFAVDGDYRNDVDASYYHSDGSQPPLLVLAIESGAVVQKVQILQRFFGGVAGSFSESSMRCFSHPLNSKARFHLLHAF